MSPRVAIFEELWPDASLEACDELLWLTPYPAGSLEQIEAMLREYRAKYGPVIRVCIAGAHREFDDAVRQAREDLILTDAINRQGSLP